MTIKRVRLNENVHEKLLHLKRQSQARSINDVIAELIEIGEEAYINNGTLKLDDKDFAIRYSKGKLVEIKIRK